MFPGGPTTRWEESGWATVRSYALIQRYWGLYMYGILHIYTLLRILTNKRSTHIYLYYMEGGYLPYTHAHANRGFDHRVVEQLETIQ